MRPLLAGLAVFSLFSCTSKDVGGPDDTATTPIDTGEPTTADGGSTDTGAVDTGPVDADADGVPASEDCNDTDPDIHPGATEVCDGVDNDCDDLVDDADPDVDLSTGGTWYTDMDRDGYGVDDEVVQGCEQPKTATELAGDCDDADRMVNPGSEEICNGIDDNCDAEVDEGVCTPLLEGVVGAGELETYIFGVPRVPGGYGAVAGDLNGDGFEDVLNGIWSEEEDPPRSGTVSLVFGPLSGPVDLTDVTTRLVGAAKDDAAGLAAAAGDLNADGYDDILVGAEDVTYVVHSPVTGVMSLADADGLLPAAGTSSSWWYPAGIGDINGDGLDDVMIGDIWASASYHPSGFTLAGAAYVYYGPATGFLDADDGADADATLYGPNDYTLYGYETEAAGDVNGDGVGDVVVSASSSYCCGGIFVQYGPLSGATNLYYDTDVSIWPQKGEEFHGDISAAEDVNGDGSPDLIFGATNDDEGGDDAGAAFLFTSPLVGEYGTEQAIAKVVGTADDMDLGTDVLLAGDMDLDGFSELAVFGYPIGTARPDSVGLYLLHGPLTGTVSVDESFATVISASEGSDLSYFSDHGDVTGDSYPDIIVGASQETLDDTVDGVIWVIPGGP